MVAEPAVLAMEKVLAGEQGKGLGLQRQLKVLCLLLATRRPRRKGNVRMTGNQGRPIATVPVRLREEERHWAAKPTRWKALAVEPAALVMARVLVAGLGRV